jgi:hypothetical protein
MGKLSRRLRPLTGQSRKLEQLGFSHPTYSTQAGLLDLRLDVSQAEFALGTLEDTIPQRPPFLNGKLVDLQEAREGWLMKYLWYGRIAMKKIASPTELQAELKRLLAYCETHRPRREVLAYELTSLANRLAMRHPSEEAKKKYLGEHPGADPKNHTVGGGGKEGKAGQKAVDEALSKSKTPAALLRGMGLGVRDARAVVRSWFEGKEPTDPKHQKAWDYLTQDGSKGQKQVTKLVDEVQKALRKSGESPGFKDVARAVDTFLGY